MSTTPLTSVEQAPDDTALPQAQPRRENFIPIGRQALMDRLAREEKRDTKAARHHTCKDLFRYLSAWRHQTYQRRLTRLKQCYLPFSPDRDTKRVLQYTPEQLEQLKADLIRNIKVLLVQANYEAIDKDRLEELLQANSAHGLELKVDLSEFDEVLIYARGRETEIIEKRVPDNLYLFKRKFEVPVYKRLFLLLKLKSVDQRIKEIMQDENISEKAARRKNRKQRRGLPEDPDGSFVYLRLFKNIPREDMEMMFPNTQVKLRLFDKVKLGLTAGGGTVAGVAGAASKIAAAVATANPIALAGAILGIVGLLFRQVMSIFNTRTKYMMQLAQRLFFHSLANNRGVLTLLVDRAEEEDIKEEMLLYFFLLRNPMPASELRENGRLDVMIEEFLTREFGVIVDFDLEEALGRLNSDHLLAAGLDNTIRAIPPKEACAVLERKWRKLLSSDDDLPAETEYEAEI